MYKSYKIFVIDLELDKEQYNIIDTMCHRASVIYNTSLDEAYNFYEDYQNGIIHTYVNYWGVVIEKGPYVGYIDLNKKVRNSKDDKGNTIYTSLPCYISQQIVKKIDREFGSFFRLSPEDAESSTHKPKYLEKDSRLALSFSKRSFKYKEGYLYITVSKDLHKGRLKLIKLPSCIHPDTVEYISYIEIVPKLNNHEIKYEMHITYETQYLEDLEETKELERLRKS